MKKLFSFSILLMLLLTACGASNGNPTGFAGSQNNRGTQPLPLATELVVGILKLEGTPQAVTADEAKQLLPLWLTYQSMSTSDSSAQQEVEALINQIHDTLTPDQQQAITNMKLTGQDMFTVMQQMGINFGRQGGTPGANGTRTPRNGGGFNGGGFPGGFQGGPGGGNGFNGGQQPSQQQIATFQALRSQNGSGFANRIPTPLLDALIQVLQKTAGIQPTSTPGAQSTVAPSETPAPPPATATP